MFSLPTRNNSTLEIILSNLHSFFHPPSTLPPLQVDQDKDSADTDHTIVVMAPLSNQKYAITRKKKRIKTRHLPISNFAKFEKQLQSQDWFEIMQAVEGKVEIFHNFLRKIVNENFYVDNLM